MYKATDSRITDLKTIKAFAKKNKSDFTEIKPVGAEANIVYITYVDYILIFRLDSKTVAKVNLGRYVDFTYEELKFIDELSFELTEEHNDETGQEVTDCFSNRK